MVGTTEGEKEWSQLSSDIGINNEAVMNEANDGLYIVLLSIHGLIRGQNLELGRDADTGGQTLRNNFV